MPQETARVDRLRRPLSACVRARRRNPSPGNTVKAIRPGDIAFSGNGNGLLIGSTQWVACCRKEPATRCSGPGLTQSGGLNMISSPAPDSLTFWGKARPREGRDRHPCHAAASHNFDVAAVAEVGLRILNLAWANSQPDFTVHTCPWLPTSLCELRKPMPIRHDQHPAAAFNARA